jgi:hypothetical protein
MIDLDKYKTQPYEIESDVLEGLPMKDIIELTNYINDTFATIVDRMKIHKINIDKISSMMKSNIKSK